ncbi:hypothetical protein OS493_003275 [Desmophyllum pertusum]|uniref:REJ domain-containing protein n=1 Tax=Desmophyllum pertusum TaxID=174260 RepID=A0A9X0CGK1_9CNID|nr:hypothetical protein OS493_003275 [Desmophyllum pertusum]
MRCLINCDKVASVSTRISVTTTCTGQACNTAKYQWQLVTVNSNGDKLNVIILTRDKTETDLNLPGIIIKDNQLTQLASSLFYLLKVQVSQDNGPSGNAAYQFRMNAPPSSGWCTVKPETGEALKTKFDFICSGWQDPDKPLMYEFNYKTDNGLYTVVSYGSVEHVTTVLPPGKKENDYVISFEIIVTDSLSAAKRIHLNIKVGCFWQALKIQVSRCFFAFTYNSTTISAETLAHKCTELYMNYHYGSCQSSMKEDFNNDDRTVRYGLLLHRIPWPRGSATYQEICNLYYSYITGKYGKPIVVFDVYEKLSTKNMPQGRPTAGKVGATVTFSQDMIVTMKKDQFLLNVNNK